MGTGGNERLDLFNLAQQSHQFVMDAPLQLADLDNLFLHIARLPSLFDLAVQHLRPDYIKSSEMQHGLLWGAMLRLHEQHGITAFSFELVVADILRATAVHDTIPADFVVALVQQNSQGLAWNTFCRPLEFAVTVEVGRDLLMRFLYERAVAEPVARVMRFGPGGVIPRDLPQFIAHAQSAVEQVAEIGRTSNTPSDMGSLIARYASGVSAVQTIVEGALVRQGLALVVADSGVGKTLLILNMDVSIATGTSWLESDHFQVPEPMRVGCYSIETGEFGMVRNARNMLRAKQNFFTVRGETARAHEIGELFLSNLEIFVDDDRLPDLGDSASVRRWAREVERAQFRKVTIDPLFYSLGGMADDLKNSAKVYKRLKYAASHIADAGAQLQVVHHNVADRISRERFSDWPDAKKGAFPVLLQVARQTIAINKGAEYQAEDRTLTLNISIVGKGNIAGSGQFQVVTTEGRRYDRWSARVTPRSELIENSQAASLTRTQQRVDVCLDAIEARIREAMSVGLPGLTANQIFNSGRWKVSGVGAQSVHSYLRQLCAGPAPRLRPVGELFVPVATETGNASGIGSSSLAVGAEGTRPSAPTAPQPSG